MMSIPTPQTRRSSHRGGASLALAGLLCGLLWAPPAAAQLRLPGGLGGGLGGQGGTAPLLPRLPATPPLNTVSEGTLAALDRTLQDVPLAQLRQRTVRELLQRHDDVLEADPAGEPAVRAELVLFSPAAGTVARAQALGFRVLREETLAALDQRTVVLAPPRGMGTAEALQRLRALDPELDADFNHVYTRSGGAGSASALAVAGGAAVPARRVGLIDSGVDAQHPALRGVALSRWGCEPADAARLASAHGTAVASLLMGSGAGAPPAPGSALLVADVYCGQASGGSVEAVARALGWLAEQRVGVINLSLVGPANRLLERVIAAMNRRGHLLVSAVGNDGPAAPPLYPAAYAGVVGVTAVNARRQVLPEAAQGPQVSFAAPGAEVVAAAPGRGTAVVRGTSFAAPQVAALLADRLPGPDAAAATRAVLALVQGAVDLGTPGRDTVYGWGLAAAGEDLSAGRSAPSVNRP